MIINRIKLTNKYLNSKQYIKDLKEKIINNDYYIHNENKNEQYESDIIEQVMKTCIYFWYYDTNDTRISLIHNVLLPNNLERPFSFNDYDLIDIGKIFAYIKYEINK